MQRAKGENAGEAQGEVPGASEPQCKEGESHVLDCKGLVAYSYPNRLIFRA